MIGGGRERSLDLDRFLDACDRVFEGQLCPPAPDASTLADEFQMLTQGMVCNALPCCQQRDSLRAAPLVLCNEVRDKLE